MLKYQWKKQKQGKNVQRMKDGSWENGEQRTNG